MNDYDVRNYRVLNKLKIAKLTKAALIVKDSGIKGLNKRLADRKAWKRNSNVDNRVFENIEFKVGAIDIVVDSSYNIAEVIELLKNLEYQYNLFYIMNKPKEKERYYGISEYFLSQYFLYRSFVFITKRKRSSLKNSFYNCIPIRSISGLSEKIKSLTENIETLKVLSNYNNKNNITAKAATFFNYYGYNYYSGGAERYLVDLYNVCKKLGCNMDIYQNAEIPFMRKFDNINVIGLPNKRIPLNYSVEYICEQSKNYECASKYFSQLHIYSAFYECYPYCSKPSIGISHGVAWDNRSSIKTNGLDFWNRNLRMIESAAMCDKMVSVDTNTANWFQTIDFMIGNQKIKVIPNYVDTNKFAPDNSLKKKKDKIVITYPRRLYEPRGMYLLLNIVDKLFEKYNNIEIHFVGKGFDDDVKNIEKKMKKYPGKIYCYSQTPDKMNEVYKKSDISLIPTLYSEGTSLSCLEAMSTGNIVISTRIGGLSDLIINGYNGYLIEPTEEDLLITLENVLDNYEKQTEIRKRAQEVAKVFNKDIWVKRWLKLLKSFDIKNKSETIDLVEFYVNDVNHLSKHTFEEIQKQILLNRLVYIRSKKVLEDDNISCGLLQIVPWNEEVVSEPIKIFIESKLKNIVKRKGNKQVI